MSQSEIARLAFTALITEVRRKTPSASGSEYLLHTELVLRNSTALAPESLPRGANKANSTPRKS
jgi:hypothetical protein